MFEFLNYFSRIRTRTLFLFVLFFAISLKVFAFMYSRDAASFINLPLHYGAAINLAMGKGYTIYPIPGPNFDSASRLFHGHEILEKYPRDENQEEDKLFFFNPGIPTVLAITYRLFSFDNYYYQIFQLLIGLLHTVLIMLIVYQLIGSSWLAAFSGFVHALFLPEIRFSLYIGREIYTTTAALLFVLCSIYLFNRQSIVSYRRVALFGMLVGVCILFRSTASIYVLSSFLWIIFLTDRKVALGAISTFVLSAFIVVTPWCLRNYLHGGSFRVSDESQFFAAWAGIGYLPNSVGANATDTVAFQTTSGAMANQGIRFQSYYSGGSLQYELKAKELWFSYLKAHPFTFVRNWIEAVLSNVLQHNRWPYYDFVRSSYPIFSDGKGFGALLEKVLYGISSVLILCLPWLAFVGIFFFRERRLVFIYLLMLGSAAHIGIAAAGYSRYITHVYALNIILAALALHGLNQSVSKLVKRLRNREVV